MARGVNKVILIGNVGTSVELRYTASGSAVASISLATTDSWRDKGTGQTQERTEWHKVVFFSRLAEIVGEYVRKGSKIYIEGTLRTRKWQDKTGIERYTTEVVANEMHMLDSRDGKGTQSARGENAAPSGAKTYPEKGFAQDAQASSAASQKPDKPKKPDSPAEFEEDDIPFAPPTTLDGIAC